MKKKELLRVSNPGIVGKTSYLPHRPVIRKDRETTKVRIVLDGSAKEKDGKSLNEFLHPGPCLLSHIYGILIRFGFGKIGMVADVRQAFLNIEIDEKDKNFVRFSFVDPDEENKLIVYRFNHVCFGLTSSPFLLNATIKYHMNTLKHETEFTEKTKRDIYVDDVTSAVNSLEEGKRFYTFLTDSMSCAGLSLQKWYSNSNELRRFMKCDGGENKMRKVLGIPWYDDQFIFDFRSVVGDVKPPLTKRNVLSVGSKFYDPLGLISPVVLIAKLFFQKLCLDELMWDEPLPEGLQKLWKKYVNDLLEVGFISVERYLFKGSEDEVKLINLHGFCDASNHAYCAVIRSSRNQKWIDVSHNNFEN